MLLGATAAQAQISLTTAVDLALRTDPRMRMAQADVDRSRYSLAEAKDVYIPTGGAAGGYGVSTGVPLGLPVVFSLSSQSLLFNFSQHDNLRAAHSGLEASMLALQEMHQKVAEDTTVTYVGLANAQQRLAATNQEYGFANRLVTIVDERLQAGQDTRMELLRARRTAAQIHIEQLRLEDEVAILADHLSHLVALPADQLTTEPASIPTLPALKDVPDSQADSPGIQAAFATARSKQETAFGAARYRFRPQIVFDANYSRISTSHTNYDTYYPAFSRQLSYNAAAIGVQISVPIFDRAHQDRARGASAEAAKSLFEAQDQRNQFLEGRFKLRHTAAELSARTDLAEIDRQLAQEQIDVILAQLTAAAGNPDKPQMTPKDEQNARLQERAKFIELLDAQLQLNQAQINLLRQSGQLDAWLKLAAHTDAPAPATIVPVPTSQP